MGKQFSLLMLCFFACITIHAQEVSVSGTVKNDAGTAGVPYATVSFSGKECVCDSLGHFLCQVKKGNHQVEIKAVGYQEIHTQWNITGTDNRRTFTLQRHTHELTAVTVTSERRGWDVKLQTQTQGTTIYAGKKNEIIDLDKLPANTAINNARQIYARVPGINIIENDEAGVQLSIATRGLNPNRTTEFNSRQNGYDISADPIGYPETYYTPPSDALSSIEIIRGAASLQYGTQFGGLLNFRFKEAPGKPFELVTKQTVGSYGFFNSFNSIGGQDKKWSYYGFYNYKRSDGWRANTGFGVHHAYTSVKYAISDKLVIGAEYTFMHYTMRQPGGLTEEEFYSDPKMSLRSRNWFSADWNIPVLTLDYAIDSNNLLSVKTYALLANRKNVGDLDAITTPDTLMAPRTVMNDTYRNYYVEARFIHHYTLIRQLRSSFLAGIRYYHGNTHRIQGYNYTGSNADFSVRNMDSLQINYRFPSYNIAAFAENVFQLTRRFSVTPGIRFEYIRSRGVGYTMADTTINRKTYGNEDHPRSFPLLGIGVDYKVSEKTDAYANFSQNYSPVNFGDIVVVQPTYRVDSALKDVKGYNIDIGYRGQIRNLISFDLSGFYLLYRNRIGTLQQTDGDDNVYQFETNISDSRSLGTELYGDINLLHLWYKYRNSSDKISLFGSLAYTDARYIHASGNRRQFNGKLVEYAAPWIYRFGVDYLFKNLSGSLQYSYTDPEFSDATNATSFPDASIGIIPAYHTVDFTTSYSFRQWLLSFSINNLTNTMYFTRRTTGFPGPGIIPSEGRSFYITAQFKL